MRYSRRRIVRRRVRRSRRRVGRPIRIGYRF